MTPEAHHTLAIEMNQQVWRLLGIEDRTEIDNRKLEHFALASLYHWQHSPKFAPVNAQRGHWLLARVYAVLNAPQKAMAHAQQCMELTETLQLKDFDLAYAHEALARAHACEGSHSEALTHRQLAVHAGDDIAGEKDRTYFMSDLKEQPWFGLESE